MIVVQEGDVDPLDLPAALDVDVVGPVHHDLGDARVQQERLERPEATDLGDDLLDQPQAFVPRDREPVRPEEPVHDRRDLPVDVAPGVHGEQGVRGLDDLILEAPPDVAQPVLPSRDLGRLRGSRGRDRIRAGLPEICPLLRALDPPAQGHGSRSLGFMRLGAVMSSL